MFQHIRVCRQGYGGDGEQRGGIGDQFVDRGVEPHAEPFGQAGRFGRISRDYAGDLEPVRALADLILDTSKTTVPELKDRLDQLYQDQLDANLLIIIRSFGFKFGVNTDADMVLDGRFLPNPFYDPELRPCSGLDEPVVRFLEKDGEALVFLDRLQPLFDYLIPRYRKEKKRYFTIDIGCTGGHHRSVYLVERLARRLQELGFQVLIRHRDLKPVFPLPENLGSNNLKSKSLEPRSLEPKSLEPKSLEPKSLEPRSLEPRSLEPKSLEKVVKVAQT